ncbi:MAG: hypothetical protein FJX71_03785 [Alphaproteobacteria bacterium]|nr:hypothetical protein [Alphaproteobacteria bacterium]
MTQKFLFSIIFIVFSSFHNQLHASDDDLLKDNRNNILGHLETHHGHFFDFKDNSFPTTPLECLTSSNIERDFVLRNEDPQKISHFMRRCSLLIIRFTTGQNTFTSLPQIVHLADAFNEAATFCSLWTYPLQDLFLYTKNYLLSLQKLQLDGSGEYLVHVKGYLQPLMLNDSEALWVQDVDQIEINLFYIFLFDPLARLAEPLSQKLIHLQKIEIARHYLKHIILGLDLGERGEQDQAKKLKRILRSISSQHRKHNVKITRSGKIGS